VPICPRRSDVSSFQNVFDLCSVTKDTQVAKRGFRHGRSILSLAKTTLVLMEASRFHGQLGVTESPSSILFREPKLGNPTVAEFPIHPLDVAALLSLSLSAPEVVGFDLNIGAVLEGDRFSQGALKLFPKPEGVRLASRFASLVGKVEVMNGGR
jgi:hypothetical protein